MNTRNTFFVALLFALPLFVALFDIPFIFALIIVLLLAAGRWATTMGQFSKAHEGPPFVLETIGASHFAEKVRWPMDQLGLDYRERVCAGTLGAFYRGRTVPVLEFRSGHVWSRIGNSTEILRYLWGACGDARDAAFLEPRTDRVELETRLDRYGRNLQVWLYWHLLEHKPVMLKAWGAADPAVPAWQRIAIRVLYPVQVILIRRAFRLSEQHYASALGHIEALLAEVDAAIAATPASILGDEEANYTDLAFAALSTPWVLPENFSGRRLLSFDDLPAPMQADIERLRLDYPLADAFVRTLYECRNNGGETS